ncbi:stage V sporulation protein S [Proteinivorax tanatarense]|uniref:Stage V sporulation protein S n=1 Tax=Proteinivorax tanatarense TaxID=1260629 RepID=A0AAU7VMR5_9FIRM
MQDKVLKVAETTNLNALVRVMKRQIKEKSFVEIQSIGQCSSYKAVKALIKIREYYRDIEKEVELKPEYVEIKTEGGKIKTAIKWNIKTN